MTPKLDGGPCLARDAVPVGPDEDAVELEQRLSQRGVQTVHRALAQLAGWDGRSPIGVLQDASQATKAPRLKKQDGAIDWGRSAAAIRNQVRAFKPWPGSYTAWRRPEGEPLRLILDRVSIPEADGSTGTPGEIVRVGKRELVVATGDGLLAIDRLQPAGKRAMDVGEFLRGHHLETGQCLL
jgi:methionyl-tRNA formyltransferase